MKQKKVIFQTTCLAVFGLAGLAQYFGKSLFPKTVISWFEMTFILGQYISLASIFISFYQLLVKSGIKLQFIFLTANLLLYGSTYWAILFMLSYYPIIFIAMMLLTAFAVLVLKWAADKKMSSKDVRVSWKLVWSVLLFSLLFLVGGLFFSREATEKEVLKKYPTQSSERSALSAAIFTYQAVLSKWPKDKEELKKYIVDNKGDFNFEPYKNLSFNEKDDRTLEVSFDYDSGGKLVKEVFELKP